MKNIYYILNCTALVGIFLSFNSTGLQAQTNEKLNPVCLDNTEQFTIASKYVAGENYVIQVGLPGSYSSADKSYPVLYIIDGDVLFGMIRESADWFNCNCIFGQRGNRH